MKRFGAMILAVMLLLTTPFCASAEGETVLTLDIPKGEVTYTGDTVSDAFALAVGFSLADNCPGLSGYALTVKWDPAVLTLNTNYTDGMSDNEMAQSKGCYFSDLYQDGLVIAPQGMYAVNYRKVAQGEITVVSIGLENIPYRQAVLFVLDMIPVCNNVSTEISVEVKENVGLMSGDDLIENYRAKTTVSLQIGDVSLRGDADMDGTLSIADAALIKRHARDILSLNDTAFLAADFNGDGTVDVKDYLLVCKELQNK